jgi:VCBS repeat-containing protein
VPVAHNVTNSGDEDPSIPIFGSLRATDADGDTLTYSLDTGPQVGTVDVAPNGRYSYIPPPHFHGTVSFTYVATDGKAQSNIATATITINSVNDPPVAQNGTASGVEDVTLSGTLNATDADDDSLSFEIVTNVPPEAGSVEVNPSGGTFTFNAVPNFNGTVSFTYRANDDQSGSNIATVTITINPVNDAPVAENVTNSGDEDPSIPVFGDLKATDVDGNPLTYRKASDPQVGTVDVAPNGRYSYIPPPNFHGTVTFTYLANDGQLDSNEATVTITINPINDPPFAENAAAAVNQNGVLNGKLSVSDRDGDKLTTRVITPMPETEGTVVVNPDGTYRFTPAPGFSGATSFTYRANDGQADSNDATVNITVSMIFDVPFQVQVSGGTQLSVNANPGGSVTIVAARDAGGQFIVYLPPGTTVTGGSLLLRLDPFTLTGEPGIFIGNAVLPADKTKTVIMPIGSGTAVCIVERDSMRDVEVQVMAQTGRCASPIAIPGPGGGTVSDASGHTVKREPGADTIDITGLRNTLVQMWRDSDFDGFRDAKDQCAKTNLDGPIPTRRLYPGHMGDDRLIRGCNASQILACKPGRNEHERQHGLSVGTQIVFALRLGWAARCR